MNNRKCVKGITLIELIITLGLLGVITALVFSFFFTNKNTLNKVEIKSDLQYEAKEVMNKIARYAMEATKVEYKEDEPTIKFIMVDNSVAVFTVKGGRSIEHGGKVSIEGKEITFGDGGDSDATLCASLKSISLSGDKDKNIQVELELEKKGVIYSVKDSFLFRNSK